MRHRFLALFALALFAALVLAAPALADEGGEGLYGKANDKVITNFGFGLMIFFTLIVTLFSIAQHLLGKRRGK